MVSSWCSTWRGQSRGTRSRSTVLASALLLPPCRGHTATDDDNSRATTTTTRSFPTLNQIHQIHQRRRGMNTMKVSGHGCLQQGNLLIALSCRTIISVLSPVLYSHTGARWSMSMYEWRWFASVSARRCYTAYHELLQPEIRMYIQRRLELAGMDNASVQKAISGADTESQP